MEQENLPFDPSGTSGLHEAHADAIHSEQAGQGNRHHGNETIPTQTAGYTVAADGSLNLFGVTYDEKVAQLEEMFPSLPRLTIEQSLKKHGSDISRAMDVLLNLTLFHDETDADGSPITLPKGIDGFMEEGNNVPIPKKSKKSGKGRQEKEGRKESQLNSLPADTIAPNKWEAGQKDVEFICARTSAVLKRDRVTSAYHANGMSLPATIKSLAEADAPKDEGEIQKESVMAVHVAELAQDFPSVTVTTLAGLLTMTQNAIPAASELAAKLTSQPGVPPLSEIIRFTTPPVNLEPEAETPKRRKAKSGTSLSYEQACASASAEFAAGEDAFAQASQAYRRGASDPLMRQAAAYYREVGNEHIAKAKEQTSAASDAIVANQSTERVVDLHGVPVQDAVRISRDRVTAWWDSLGDSKYMHGGGLQAHGGLKLITGVGRHSRDGTSRIGPAVKKTLDEQGWRVEDGGGFLTVIGTRRR